MTPGEVIKQRRQELGLTQDQLAERVGHIDRSAISNIERGRIGLGHERALRFADALGLEPKTLDGVSSEPRPTLQTVLDRLQDYAAEASEERGEIVLALERLSAEVASLSESSASKGARAQKAQAR